MDSESEIDDAPSLKHTKTSVTTDNHASGEKDKEAFVQVKTSLPGRPSGPVLHRQKAIHMHSIAIFAKKIFPVTTKGKRTSLDTRRLLSKSVTSNQYSLLSQ